MRIIGSFFVICVLVGVSLGQQPIDGIDARSNSAEFAKQLGSTDPLLRQRSAEALARLAATEHRKLVEGYQLQEKNKDEFFRLMIRFAILAAIYIAMAVYAFYLNQMLQIRWRRWMTDVYLQRWLADRTYYRMQLTGAPADNPDQRIAEDFKLFVDETLSLSLGFLNAVVTLGSFVGILWTLSGPFAIPYNGGEIVIPGYMVWAALIYAIAGTWMTHKIGKALIGLNFNQQRFEADFRFSLVRFRENGEGVALYGGEEDELRNFRTRFGNVVENWWRIMKRQKVLNSFTIGYNQLAVIFPFVGAGNRYFAGTIQLGGLMQISASVKCTTVVKATRGCTQACACRGVSTTNEISNAT